jgi:hypothetical protein
MHRRVKFQRLPCGPPLPFGLFVRLPALFQFVFVEWGTLRPHIVLQHFLASQEYPSPNCVRIIKEYSYFLSPANARAILMSFGSKREIVKG